MEKISFKDFNLEITLTPFINIIGSHSSGKTTLLREMINKNSNSGVYLDDSPVSSYDISYLKQNMAAVLNNFEFKTGYVKEELLYYQNELKIEKDIAYNNIEKFSKFFGIEELLDTKVELLTLYEKAYIKILSLLIIRPHILGIDDMLTYLKFDEKMKIIKYASSNNICIINITSNPEELLFGTDIIILDNHSVLVYDETDSVLASDKYLNKIGMNFPFIVEMSTNLNYYDLLKKKYFDMNSLVGELWK